MRLPTFWALVCTDLYLIKQTIRTKIIDLLIWVAGTLMVTTYLWPAFGMQASYGAFALASACASVGIMTMMPNIAQLVSDLQGDQVMLYYMTLPMASHLVLLRLVVSYAITLFILGVATIFFGCIAIFYRLDMHVLTSVRLPIMLVVAPVFYGVMTLLLASVPAGMHKVRSVWARFIFPLWMLGGMQHSWDVLYGVNRLAAYVALANPVTYVMEGFRHAITGKPSSISFPVCVVVLLVCTVAGYLYAVKRWKHKLDFV